MDGGRWDLKLLLWAIGLGFYFMQLEKVIQQCLSYPETVETTPFGPEVLVHKVCGKMFTATNPDEFPSRINLKCDPNEAIELREQYEAVQPGWHMNKKHWNTVVLDGSLPTELVEQMVESSYRLVVMSLKKVDRERIIEMLDAD